MNCIPVKTSEGNILLKAKGLAVGRLNLPIGFVMGYIKKNYQLPNWVYINQKKKTILLDLNKYTKIRQCMPKLMRSTWQMVSLSS